MDGTTYSSLELRWFVAGSVPDTLLEYFVVSGSPAFQEQRRDSYWPLPRADVGVKRRNGGPLEMKVRRSAQTLQLPSGLEVVTEQWNKWRPRRLTRQSRQAEWIDVDKDLWTRVFGPFGREVSSPADGRRPLCEVEVASLTLGAASWWTIAFEATGPATVQSLVLQAALDAVWSPGLEEWVGQGLNAGYPEWLEQAPMLTSIH